jgi:8-oxo-dGTP pyrophosphatase MutT (NUDIX family)
MSNPRWPCLRHARLCNGPPRVPFVLAEAPQRLLGSVARAHLPRLRGFPDAFAEMPGALALRLAPEARDARLAEIHAVLRDEGLILAWRDEPYPLRDAAGGEHGTIERAASRFWGTLTLGAHCNGYVADASGRPTHLWIARRADTKPTDPGRLDNLIGGGVPRGQSPRAALIREGWEEAGLVETQFAGLRAAEVLELECDIPEGRQHEHLHVFDLALPAGVESRNLDGEVAWHRCMPVDEAIARAAGGELTTDAALATLAFALRHGLLEPPLPGAESTARATLDDAGRRAFEALVVRAGPLL